MRCHIFGIFRHQNALVLVCSNIFTFAEEGKSSDHNMFCMKRFLSQNFILKLFGD